MAQEISKLFVTVGAKTDEFQRGIQSMKKGLLVAGAAMTAVGAAGLALVASTKAINAQLSVTALNLSVTTKEMRDLTLETTNVTFSIQEVTASFDLLARAGIKDTEVLKATATAFDTLGDAVGQSASQVAATMIPAMKTFGLSATEMAGKIDIMTYMSRKSTLTLDDFNTMVGYTTPQLVEQGLTIEELTASLIHMERQGYAPGRVMTREFMKATTKAQNENISLSKALGITTQEMAMYTQELAGATGMTQKYADVANEQYTLMDELKQRWSEVTLGASAFLEPLEPILAGMTALGPLMIFLSTSAGTAAVKWGLHTAALVAHKVAILGVTVATRAWSIATGIQSAIMNTKMIPQIIDTVHVLYTKMAAIIALIGVTKAHIATMIAHRATLIASTIAIKAITAAQWLWNIAMMANPIGLIIAGVVVLIAAGVALWRNWEKIKDGITGAINAIIEGINKLIEALNKIPAVNIGTIRKVGGEGLGMNIPAPALPQFGTGGVFTRPTAGIIGDMPEVLTPLSKLGGLGGRTIIVNIAGSVVTERDLISSIKEALLIDQGSNVTLGFT